MGLLVFAIIRKFIWTSSSLLTIEMHGGWGRGGGGGGEYKSGTAGKLPPKAKLDSLYVSLEMLESRSVINYCIPIIISNAITHSLFDVPDYIFLILLVIHRRLQIFHGLVQFKVTSYTSYLKTDYFSFKIFPRFLLAKSARIIPHNQLLRTKFGRILCLTNK